MSDHTIILQGGKYYPDIVSLDGEVAICTEAKVPNLKVINGSVLIFLKADVPNLEVITGSASIYSGANLPKLEIIGKDAYINISDGAVVSNLKYIGGKAHIS